MARHFLFGGLAERIAPSQTVERALWAVEGGLAAFIWRMTAALPVERASEMGARLGCALGPKLRKHKHVRANLAVAFADKSEDEREAIARASWANLGRMIAELPHLAALAHDPKRVWIEDRAGISELLRDRPAIFVTAHVGNWNLAPVAPTRLGVPLTVIYRKQTNPRLEAFFVRARRGLPWRHLEVEEAARGLLRELERGRSVGLLPDQRFEDGELVPFFGRPAPTPIAPARIALKLGLPFVPGRVVREDGCRFRIEIHPPLEPDHGIADLRARAFDLTVRLNQLFEQWIREYPEQWLCAKRRWPRAARAGGTGEELRS